MNPLDQVNGYLRALESRLRWSAISRGIACTALAALVATVLLVVIMDAFSFSAASLPRPAGLLFLSLALAIGFGLVIPFMRLNRRWTARRAEQSVPCV